MRSLAWPGPVSRRPKRVSPISHSQAGPRPSSVPQPAPAPAIPLHTRHRLGARLRQAVLSVKTRVGHPPSQTFLHSLQRRFRHPDLPGTPLPTDLRSRIVSVMVLSGAQSSWIGSFANKDKYIHIYIVERSPKE